MKVIDLKPDEELAKEVREYFPHPALRKYQASLANSVYKCLLDGAENIVVECPTGLGKAFGGGLYPAATGLMPDLPPFSPRRPRIDQRGLRGGHGIRG
ncbi:MAG: hypothetical protein QXG35_08985 [Nitrososphaerota archaeon]